MAGGATEGGRALVLGGGGVAGIAWTTGLLVGLADAGDDATAADLVVGTSAGSAVGAQVGSGASLSELFARQVDPDRQAAEIPAEIDLEKMMSAFAGALAGAEGPEEIRRRIGAVALAAETVTEAARRAVIESRLPSHEWPETELFVVAVDAESGEGRAFDRRCGVTLVDAVAASCAVPGIWPPVTIEGRRYVDGGVRSVHNADLAAGSSEILIVVPMGSDEHLPGQQPLAEAVRSLEASGSRVTVITPDPDSLSAIGLNPLDPSTRTPAAHAGRAQGRGGRPSPTSS